jgi:hypothetical protein
MVPLSHRPVEALGHSVGAAHGRDSIYYRAHVGAGHARDRAHGALLHPLVGGAPHGRDN